MVMQDKVFDERMPSQVTAQVAPTPPDSSTPHPDSRSQPQSDSYIMSQPAEIEPLVSSALPVSTSEPDFGSSLGSSAVDVDSPEGTEARINMEGPVSSPTHSSPTMAPQIRDHVQESSHTQEKKHVDRTTPITPPSTKDAGNKMSTTPLITPPAAEQVATLDDTPGSPTPSSTARPSDRALSRLELFEWRSKGAIHKHYKGTDIFHKTRSSMRYQSRRMLIFASRGFERGVLPTRQTKPPLLKRRHSIDANTTKNWKMQNNACWLHYSSKVNELQPHAHFGARPTNIVQKDIPWVRSHEIELPFVYPSHSPIPDPRRYAAFGPAFDIETPHNNEIFLELGDVTIQNDAFDYIGATSYHESKLEVWMRGESLDMALEVLRRDEDCDAHGIDIVNSTVAQICCFAANSSNGPSGEYEQYKARYHNKNWIIVVCNDAMGGIENNGTSGSHWSMVAMDRISKRAYYYDSLYAHYTDYQNLGRTISMGLLNILDEDISRWTYEVQLESPNQNWHNLFRHDGGACGPFVFKMTQILIEHIKGQQALSLEDQCHLELDDSFATQLFKPRFHSGHVRNEIKARIRRWRHISRASAFVDQHDHYAIHDTNAVLRNGPVVAFQIPPKPRLPVLRRTHHMGRYSGSHHTRRRCSSGTNYHDPTDVDDSDENYVTYDNSSDSGRSTAGSSGGDTVVIGHDDLWGDAGVDVNMDDDDLYPDLNGSVQLIDETDGVLDEHVSAGYRRIVNNSPEPDNEEQGPSVTRLA